MGDDDVKVRIEIPTGEGRRGYFEYTFRREFFSVTRDDETEQALDPFGPKRIERPTGIVTISVSGLLLSTRKRGGMK